MKSKILIIEDDIAFGSMLEGGFRRNGFEVVLCGNVAKAKAELKKNMFSIVLSDLRLPDGDGIMLLQWVKENKKELPFIIMTSYAEIHSAVSAIKLGAEDYLQKPINPAMLREKIESVLSKKGNSPQPKMTATPKTKVSTQGFVQGKSDAAKKMYDHLVRVAPTTMSVLEIGRAHV